MSVLRKKIIFYTFIFLFAPQIRSQESIHIRSELEKKSDEASQKSNLRSLAWKSQVETSKNDKELAIFDPSSSKTSDQPIIGIKGKIISFNSSYVILGFENQRLKIPKEYISKEKKTIGEEISIEMSFTQWQIIRK